ncbi:MAG: FolC bifunctional protein [Planctomycetaceae bacterium]|nr:FolC bifunctional protein [Planctomycetaceae bacterium]
MPQPFTTYEQALDFLYNRINYERVQSSAYSAGDFKLNRMRGLLELLGNPQNQIPAVHIAGTKGKGSTAVMTASILRTAGFRVGLFTSPHLSRFEERMQVNGRQPTEAEVVDLVNQLLPPVAQLDQQLGGMSPTYFELTTAMSWLFFRQENSEIAVLEVGLGGRLDATNVCHPEVCIITSISRDHTHLLGSELQQIAREKAGIIKQGIPVVSGVFNSPAKEAIEEVCIQRQAPLRLLSRDARYQFEAQSESSETVEISLEESNGKTLNRLPVPLLGEHQAHNAALAVMAIQELSKKGWEVSDNAIRDGLRRIHWPARIEVVSRDPITIIDAAHNWASVSALIRTLDQQFPNQRRIAIFAATQDKDVTGLLRQILPQFETVILTCYRSNPRGVPAEELFALARALGGRCVHLAVNPQEAWELATQLALPEDLICISGSFFIAAELRDLILAAAVP